MITPQRVWGSDKGGELLGHVVELQQGQVTATYIVRRKKKNTYMCVATSASDDCSLLMLGRKFGRYPEKVHDFGPPHRVQAQHISHSHHEHDCIKPNAFPSFVLAYHKRESSLL